MKYRRLGSTGLKVSPICFGCMSIGEPAPRFAWAVGRDRARDLIRIALEHGINFFDTANMYAFGTSEEQLGEAIADFANRDEIVLATKCYFNWGRGPNANRLSRKAIFNQVEDSLRRLQTDYIDLYQIHRHDEDTPIEETMEALHDLVKQGKVRYLGASSMQTWQFQHAQHVAERNGWTRFVSMQNQVSLLYREEEREMLPYCEATGVGVIPWSPLARGRLTRDVGATSERSKGDFSEPGYYSEYHDAQADAARAGDDRVIAEVHALADERGVARAQIGLAWLLHKTSVTAPIVGVAQAHHITDAVAATELDLTDDEIDRLERHYIARPPFISGTDAMSRTDFTVTVRPS
ncbi:MAG: aldo/keto reductase [Actinomycetota bacterium]